MAEMDENLERQINRALDGELTADERLALDRELLRNPEARRLLEGYERLDALAGETLRSLLSYEPGAGGMLPETVAQPTRRSYSRTWWFLPGAAAAAILVTLWVYSPPTRTGTPPTGPAHTLQADARPARTIPPPAARWMGPGQPNHGVVPVSQRPAWTDRAVDRGVYGVRGSDGKLYLIEVDRTRTLEQPGRQARVVPVGGDL